MKDAREKNVESGIVLFALCSLIIFIPTSYFFVKFIFFADLQLIIGAIIGIRFTLKNQKTEQATLKTGVIAGVGGGVLSVIFISFYEWIVFSILEGFYIVTLFWLIVYTLISGVVIGLIMGVIMSTFSMYKEVKRPEEDKYIDDDFFKDLIED